MNSKDFVPEKDSFMLGVNFSRLNNIEFLRKSAKVISDHHCTAPNTDYIHNSILYHFSKRGQLDPFWISLNTDALNPIEFRSNTRNTCSEEVAVEGVSIDFIRDLLQKFAGNASGLDLSELNFDHNDAGWKMNDD